MGKQHRRDVYAARRENVCQRKRCYERLEDRRVLYAVNTAGGAGDADPNDGACDSDLVAPGSQITWAAAVDCINRGEGEAKITFGSVSGAISLSAALTMPAMIDGGNAALTFTGTMSVKNDSTIQNLIGAPISLSGSGNTVKDSRPKGISMALDASGNHILNNTISGSTSYGIQINGSGNEIRGNRIGTTNNGTAADANAFDGIFISGTGASNSIVDNIISGNNGHGIYIVGKDAGSNKIEGNKIGVAADGTTALGNKFSGIQIENSPHNTIGGDAGKRNIIAGNREYGIRIRRGTFGSTPTNSFDNQIVGNYIGIAADGATAVSNRFDGIKIDSLVAKDPGGGSSLSADIRDNVISGNGDVSGSGVFIGGSDVALTGNKIGTNAAGTAAVPNKGAGVQILRTFTTDATFIRIGGANPFDNGAETFSIGNLISGNTGGGVIYNASVNVATPAHDIKVQGNRIGTNVAGDAALSNGADGVLLEGYDILIGGGGTGEGNLISGNAGNGISATGPSDDAQEFVKIQGNVIGLNKAGNAKIPNQLAGISANTRVAIGFPTGDMPPAGTFGNTISGNVGNGISISGDKSYVIGNRIGTSVDGLSDLGNGGDGILVENGRINDIGKGGFAPNVISGNEGAGVRIHGAIANGIEVRNFFHNYIGVGANGTQKLGNTKSGIVIENGPEEVMIGGANENERNIIADNKEHGILIAGGQTQGIQVLNNYIGYLGGGAMAANGKSGVRIEEGAVQIQISGNTITGHGIGVDAAGMDTAVLAQIDVVGNLIGTDAQGTAGLGNTYGVSFSNLAQSSIRNNRIADSDTANIFVSHSSAGKILGNVLNTGPNEQQLSSSGSGIVIDAGIGIQIGDGTVAGDNVVRDNANGGIGIVGQSDQVEILRNKIYRNQPLGIILQGSVAQRAIRPVLAPPINTADLTVNGVLVGKPSTSYLVQYYANSLRDPSGYGQGEYFLGAETVTTNDIGFAALQFVFPNGNAEVVSATATEQTGAAGTTFDFAASAASTQLSSAVDAAGQLIGNAFNFIGNFFHPTNLRFASLAAPFALAAISNPIPTGQVLFYDNGVQIGSAAIDANGHVEFTSASLPAGVHHLFAVYEGDANFAGSVSTGLTGTTEGGPLGVSAGQGGANPNDEGRGVVVDAQGNSYVIGTKFYSDGASDSTSTKTGDIYLAKYDKNGTLIWQRNIGGAGDDRGLGIARDSSGNLYVTGMFQQTASFVSAAGAASINLTSRGGFDIFVASYTADGRVRWARNYGNASSSSSNADIGYGITVDSSNKIIVTGQFAGTVDFDASSSKTLNLKSKGGTDVFVLSLTSGGSTSFAKQLGGTSTDRGTAVAIDASKRIYVAGSFSSTADFDPGSGTTNLTSAGGKDAFVARLSSAGSFSYARAFGGKSNDEAHGVVVDPSNNVYTTGYFAGTADLNPGSSTSNVTSAGSNDVFVVKLNSSGNFSFGKRVGGAGDDRGRGIARTSTGDIAVIGNFNGTVDFNPASATNNLASHGGDDAFVLRLSSSGSYRSAVAIGGTGADRGRAIAVDSADKLYALGQFFESLSLDTGEGEVDLTSAGGEDLFLVRLV